MKDRSKEAVLWAQKKIGNKGVVGNFNVIYSCDSDDQFQAVVVLSNYTPRNVDVHLAAEPKFWFKKILVKQLFNVVFHHVFCSFGAARATGLVRSTNDRCQHFVERLGFKFEGVMREAFEDGDLAIYGFLKNEYFNHKWCAERPS